MKIKKKKQVNLPKLIERAWENGIKGVFKSINNENVKVEIGTNFVDTFFGNIYPYPDSLFEIEEEVEIDEDTKLTKVIVINNNNIISFSQYHSINYRLNSGDHAMFGTKFIYLQNDDGSIGELVWENGKMVE